jgi:HD-like signal output (HDOD) protein
VSQDPILAAVGVRLQQQLDQDSLVLPSLPEVALQVRYLAQDPRSSLKQIADAISADPAMASQLMRLAQTMRYSHPGQPITTLPIAISRIGLQGTVNVALALAIQQLFSFHSPQIRLLCREIQQKSAHISRFALTLSDTLLPEQAHQAADFIVLAAVLLDIGCLPLLAELDQLVTTGVRLPENPTLLNWSQQLRLPLGLAMLNKWQLDASFAELLPLQLTAETQAAARMLILAHDYYLQRQSDPELPALPEVRNDQALHPLSEGEEYDRLQTWVDEKQ